MFERSSQTGETVEIEPAKKNFSFFFSLRNAAARQLLSVINDLIQAEISTITATGNPLLPPRNDAQNTVRHIIVINPLKTFIYKL